MFIRVRLNGTLVLMRMGAKKQIVSAQRYTIGPHPKKYPPRMCHGQAGEADCMNCRVPQTVGLNYFRMTLREIKK
jgi:hypothetical protein